MEKPYWNYEDIGVFFLILVFIGSLLRLFVRFHLLARSKLTNPSASMQFALISTLSLALYSVLNSDITDLCCARWVGSGHARSMLLLVCSRGCSWPHVSRCICDPSIRARRT